VACSAFSSSGVASSSGIRRSASFLYGWRSSSSSWRICWSSVVVSMGALVVGSGRYEGFRFRLGVDVSRRVVVVCGLWVTVGCSVWGLGVSWKGFNGWVSRLDRCRREVLRRRDEGG